MTSDKEILAHWMMRHGYATGHGDTTEDLLEELKWQIAERSERAVAAEREECAYIADQGFRRAAEGDEIADLIRARGQQ